MTTKGAIEAELRTKNKVVAGVDEVGRGCIAGPVYAGCVVLNYEALVALPPKQLELIRDSKTLSSSQRARVIAFLDQVALDTCIGVSTVREIEKFGILEATFLAMRRAISKCSQSIDMLLIDGNQPLRSYAGEQRTVVGGDRYCFAIAAASIIAKEARDHYMRDQSLAHPVYGFDRHVGYGTKQHLQAIAEFGICTQHRKNFAPIANAERSSLETKPNKEPKPTYATADTRS